MIGSVVGPYRVVDKLGEGGMGAVYRARDTKLNRDVALKVLPEAFAKDADRLNRFEREAQVLASLNHPNIAQIYGVEDAGGVRALVMELVPGRTLEEVIAAGPLPLADAAVIARQIADALEAAHDAGVIHRDLKPANIKVSDDGRVKVLDFGLAKTLQPMSGPTITAIAEAGTMTSPAATAMGVILGTAAYMSPEQARGRATDRRADVWAFGAIVFEMLTGRRPFKGDDISETIASLLRDEPDWSALPATTPPSVRRLLHRCLEKDPLRRLRSIGDAKLDLDDRELAATARVASPAEAADLPRRRFPVALAAVALIAGLSIATASLAIWTPAFRGSTVPDARRLTVTLPVTLNLGAAPAETAISPDGRQIAFSAQVTGAASPMIWVRAMNSVTPRQIPGTEDGRLPFWSPDGRDLGFFAGGQVKRTLADGTGTPQVICPAKDGRGASWNRDGVIVFAPTNVGALFRVSAGGGDPVAVTSLDASRQETGQRFPQFLPDQKHFLFVELPARDGVFQISVGSLDSQERTRLRTAEGTAVFVAPDYLVFPIRHQLAAQHFNVASLTLAGDPTMLGDLADNLEAYSGGPALTASATGVLVFPHAEFTLTELHWIDTNGKDLGRVQAPAAAYGGIRISPDGKRAAVLGSTSPGQNDLWVLDLERGGTTRLTAEQGQNGDVVWSPDSSRLLYTNDRNGHPDFYMKSVSGSGTEELVYASKDLFRTPRQFSPDGKYLVYEQMDPQTHRDIWILPMDAPRTPRAYRRTPFNELNPAISPDGHWLAYSSDETGRSEIYVESFPTPGTRLQITTNGGSQMGWRRDGKQAYVTSADGRTVSIADVLPGPEMKLGPLKTVFTASANMTTGDLSPDFQRGLIALAPDGPASRTLTVLLDWTGALRR